MVWFLTLFIILHSPIFGSGSVGDRSHDYRSCVNSCHVIFCSSAVMNGVTGGGETGGQGEVGWLLEMMGWTCLEDCQYKCMHEVTAQDLQHNRTVRQFFGKVIQTDTSVDRHGAHTDTSVGRM